MLCWVILGTGAVIVFIYAAIKLVEYIQEREDQEVADQDEPTE